jgi:hypothetical protein
LDLHYIIYKPLAYRHDAQIGLKHKGMYRLQNAFINESDYQDTKTASFNLYLLNGRRLQLAVSSDKHKEKKVFLFVIFNPGFSNKTKMTREHFILGNLLL